MLAASTDPTPGPDAALSQGERRERDPPALSVRGLRRSYGSFDAVRGIDLEVARGEIFALLGPNGAGKTTTLEIFEGFRSVPAARRTCWESIPSTATARGESGSGSCSRTVSPDRRLTPASAWRCTPATTPIHAPIDDTLAKVGLADLTDRRCEHLSGGQRRRLDVALALIGDPELLFLDEPTTGFDPAARRAMWDLVHGLRASGTTIVLTTHYMEEAERLADRIAVINDGQIVAEGTPDSLGLESLMTAEISFTVPTGVRLEQLPARIGVTGVDENGKAQVRCERPVSTMFSLTRWALEHDHQLPDLELRRPTLEDVYLHLTSTTKA